MTDVVREEAKEFARQLVRSQAYRDNLKQRLETGVCSPGLESMIWYYAYGKPIESSEIVHKRGEDFAALSDGELAKEMKELAELVERGAAERGS